MIVEALVLVEVLVGRDVAAAVLDDHLDVERPVDVEGGDRDGRVEDLDVGVVGDVGRGDRGRPGLLDRHPPRLVALELQGDRLEVEDDVGDVFDDPGDGRELVEDAVDAHGGDGRAGDRGEQDAPQGVADGHPVSPLERLGLEAPVLAGQRLEIALQELGSLEIRLCHVTSFGRCPPFGPGTLLGVQLDDQVFLDRKGDVLARGQREDPALQVLPIDLEPARHGLGAVRGHDGLDVLALGRPGPEGDDVARLDQRGGDIGPVIVDPEVAVPDELAGVPPGQGEPEQEDDVVQPPFEHGQEVLAGDPLLSLGPFEEEAELLLRHAVVPFQLLLLAELDGVPQHPLARASVLARGVGPPFEGALVGQALRALEIELVLLDAAEPAIGSLIFRHGGLLPALRPAGGGGRGSRCAGSASRP